MIKEINPKKPLDLNEWAFIYIKSRILDHEIKPGSQLNIEELSRKLNISRTPIREALLRLKQTGLVISFSRVGFFVCGITKEDFEDIFELRQLIEAYAAEKIVDKITDTEIENLLNILECGKSMAEQGKIKEYNECDLKMHDAILNSLNNRKIRDVMSSVGDLQHRISIYALSSSDNIEQSLKEHTQLFLSIKDRDASRARQAMVEHIVGIRNRLRLIVDFQDNHTTAGSSAGM